MCNLSIIIKTLNEEVGISRAIEGALAAAEAHGGEIIVADSGSTDSKVAIALQYPIEVVQLHSAARESHAAVRGDSSCTIYGLATFGNPSSRFTPSVH